MIGYCSVMGRAGEHYALGVYLGDEGISGFCDLLKNADITPYHQALHFQNCIMCSFEDRVQLAKQDREQITRMNDRTQNLYACRIKIWFGCRLPYVPKH